MSRPAPVPDQRTMWERWHTERQTTTDIEPLHRELLDSFLDNVVAARLTGPLLELGCGQGSDSIYLAQHGYQVEAIDFSRVAIERARALAAQLPDLRANFLVRDITLPLPYPNSHFVGVFAYGRN